MGLVRAEGDYRTSISPRKPRRGLKYHVSATGIGRRESGGGTRLASGMFAVRRAFRRREFMGQWVPLRSRQRGEVVEHR